MVRLYLDKNTVTWYQFVHIMQEIVWVPLTFYRYTYKEENNKDFKNKFKK